MSNEKDPNAAKPTAPKAMVDKRTVLIVSEQADKIDKIQKMIETHVQKPTFFLASDGAAALTKVEIAPPNILITDLNLHKLSGIELVDKVLELKSAERTAIIVAGQPPQEEKHIDEIVTNKVQYITDPVDDNEFNACITKALNFSNKNAQPADFFIRSLAKGQILLKDGDKAESVFFVKKGQLQAYKEPTAGNIMVLGQIGPGEFVGEMAYINGEPRSANVSALSDCELIEVPIGVFEKVLFKRPTWSKALMMTLSKRIKSANKIKKD